MTSDDNNRSNKDGEAIGGSSQTSLMSSTECGIRGPLQEQNATNSTKNMSQVLHAALSNNENNMHPPQSAGAMNTLQEIGTKRHVPIGGSRGEVPPEAKRIKVEDDLPPPIPQTKLEPHFRKPEENGTAAVATNVAQSQSIKTSLSSQGINIMVRGQEGTKSIGPPREAPISVANMPFSSTALKSASTSIAVAPHPHHVQVTNKPLTSTTTQLIAPQDNSRSVVTSSFSSAASSSSSIGGELPAPTKPLAPTGMATAQAPPLKSTQMSHLEQKYLAELEYMLREFRKLERQLLGAKGNGTGIEESAGSRERREKLHSFIMHLEDTIRQVEQGCRLEAEGKSTVTSPTGDEERQQAANSAALTNLTKEKEEEENVQKLEEHILANLLPVKVRLKKQLAAQQGATRNPIGMPVARRGLQPSAAAEMGKGTFTAAAEERRKQAEAAREAAEEKAIMAASPAAPTQFGKPLSGGGSSLTQKLHGSTLGSQARVHGHGVGSAEPAVPDPTIAEAAAAAEALEETASPLSKRKVLYGGMAPGSNQHRSGVSAAAGVHTLSPDPPPAKINQTLPIATAVATTVSKPLVAAAPVAAATNPAAVRTVRTIPKPPHPSPVPPIANKPSKKPYDNPDLTEEEQKKVRKDRRKRKKARELRRREKERQRQLFLQQQAAQASQQMPKGASSMQGKKVGKGGVMKGTGKKKGPRTVEYICALCSEAYSSTCDYNPWWALASHECPKCRKSQVPRIDITSPANAIEYHPALLAHAEEGPGGGSTMGSAPPPSVLHHMPPMPGFHARGPPPVSVGGPAKYPPMYPLSDSDDESDLSELSDAGILSEDSDDSDDSEDDMPLTEGELAELEVFGKDYDGPKLTPDQSSRLMILMGHAQTCPGRHKSVKHRDCCNSVKYLMLHVRDCPGTTATFDVCPFPWCRKVKHLMYHLVACPRHRDCAICSPIALSAPLKSLIGLNAHRRKKHRERMKAVMAAAAAAAKAKPPAPRVSYVPKGTKPTYRPPVKKTTAAKYKGATAKHPPRVTPISRPGANKPVARGLTLIKPSNGVVVKSLVKKAGRSVVILKARPQRPVLNVAKPTVAALPGVAKIESARPKARDGPTPVVSSMGAMAKPTVVTIQVPEPAPAPAPAPQKAPNGLAQPLTIAVAAQPVTISVKQSRAQPMIISVPTKAKSSAAVVKECAAAQAALAVNALQEAAKAAMEATDGTDIQVGTSKGVPTAAPVAAAAPTTTTAVVVESKPATKATQSGGQLDCIAVVTASAIAAAMVTDPPGASKPAVKQEGNPEPAVSKERAPVPIAVKPPPNGVAATPQTVSPGTSAANSEQSDSSCDVSLTHPSRKSSGADIEVVVTQGQPVLSQITQVKSKVTVPCSTTTNAVSTNFAQNQATQSVSQSVPAPLNQAGAASQKQVAPVSQGPPENQVATVSQKQGAPVSQAPPQNQATASARLLRDAEVKQENLKGSAGPQQSPDCEEVRPAPPRFPEVPSVVKQEPADEAKKESPTEVPPV